MCIVSVLVSLLRPFGLFYYFNRVRFEYVLSTTIYNCKATRPVLVVAKDLCKTPSVLLCIFAVLVVYVRNPRVVYLAVRD